MYVGDLSLCRDSEGLVLVFSYTLVVLDNLFGVSTIEYQLDHRFIRSPFSTLRQFNEGIMDAKAEMSVESTRHMIMTGVQMGTPRLLPVVCGEEHFMLSIDD